METTFPLSPAAGGTGAQAPYFKNEDNFSQERSLNRLALDMVSDGHIVHETTNLSPVAGLVFPLVRAVAMRTLHLFDHAAEGTWPFHGLTRVPGTSSFPGTLISDKPYIDRAVATCRHLAGITTDQKLPAAS